jgi:hypothetical protein
VFSDSVCQNKATIFKNITGRDATADDIKQFVANSPTKADAVDIGKMIVGTKPIDLRYDYDGDGKITQLDQQAVLSADAGNRVDAPSANSIWGGQVNFSDQQFRTKITAETEEEKVIEFLQKKGLVATPESVMSIMKDWNFDPSNPTAGLDEATKNHAVVVVPKDIGNYASIEEVSAYVMSKGFKNYSIEGDNAKTYSISGQPKEIQDRIDFFDAKSNEYAKSLGKKDNSALTPAEMDDFLNKARSFSFSPGARKVATLQDILTGNTTNIPVKEYFNI